MVLFVIFLENNQICFISQSFCQRFILICFITVLFIPLKYNPLTGYKRQTKTIIGAQIREVMACSIFTHILAVKGLKTISIQFQATIIMIILQVV